MRIIPGALTSLNDRLSTTVAIFYLCQARPSDDDRDCIAMLVSFHYGFGFQMKGNLSSIPHRFEFELT